jgi:hypothetical protein
MFNYINASTVSAETDNQMNKCSHLIPEAFFAIMGEPPVVLGEDLNTYILLLAQIGATTGAHNIVEWLMVKDIADLTWQILRIRRWIPAILDNGLRMGLLAGVDQLINDHPGSVLDRRALKYVTDHYLDATIDQYGMDGVQRLQAVLDRFRADRDKIAAANSFARNFDIFDRAEELLTRLEDRRIRALREIENRNRSFGAALRSASDAVIDAEPVITAAAPSIVPNEDPAAAGTHELGQAENTQLKSSLIQGRA